MRAIPLFFIAIVISLVMITPTALGASPDEPHGHRGLLTPITSSPTPVLLTAAERVDLEAGKPSSDTRRERMAVRCGHSVHQRES